MNFHYEYVPPGSQDWELPFLVQCLGSNVNLAEAHVQEIQRNYESGKTARIQLYHFFVLDENQKVKGDRRDH